MCSLCLHYIFFFALVAPVTKTNSCKHTWLDLILITVLRFFSVMSDFDFSSSVSYDLSEFILICWFAAQETFLIIITVEVCKPLGLYSDRIRWWTESSEKQYLFEI